MAKAKLTDAFCNRTKPPGQGRLEFADQILPGLRFRVTDKGAKSFALITRLHGKQIRVTLGPYPMLSLSKARADAREALQAVARGEDPRTAKRRARETRTDTFANIADEFLQRHGRKLRPRSLDELARPFKRWLVPRWGDRLVSNISRRDIIELMDDIIDKGTPVAANRTLAAIKTFFSWCLDRDIVEASPAAAVKRPGVEKERERVLADHEIKALWPAWDKIGYPFGDLGKMLLVTAQRRTEVARMRWSDIDFKAKVWTIPPEATKGGRRHDVPLAGLALEILESIPRFSGNFVFTTTAGAKAVSGYSRSKSRAEEISKVTGWRLHDLRRTAGTRMTQCGIGVFVVGRVLNHAPRSAVGITSVYDRYSYEPEKRHALDTWARKLETIIRPVPDKVVDLHSRA